MTSTAPTIPAADPAEVPARRQIGQRVAVYLDAAGELEQLEVHVLNPDRIRYEQTATRHPEWPSAEVSRSFVMTFLTWAAAKRQQLTELSFDQWQTKVLDWDLVEATAVDPTRPTASPADTSS